MSTPISRDNKLQGLELYAPRRARVRAVPEDEISLSPPELPDVGQIQAAETDDRPCDDGDDMADDSPVIDEADQQTLEDTALEAFEQAIHEAVDVEPPLRDSAPVAFAAPIRDRPSRLPPAENIDWPSPADSPSRVRGASRFPQRRLRLDPDIVPEPPMREDSRGAFALLFRFVVVVGAAAGVAYGYTVISSMQADSGWPKRATEALAAIAPVFHEAVSPPQMPQITSHLLAENQRAFVNEPLPLSVSVDPSTGREFLVLAGLAAGTRVSAGTPVGDSVWRVSSHDLAGLFLYAPKDFVGVMDTAIDLLSSNQRLLDRRQVRLEWLARKPVLPAVVDRADTAAPKAPSIQPIDPEQAAILMKRGQDALKTGDIAAARLAFGRVADAGNADAALALAVTYDPGYLARQNVVGVVGDEAKARAWYQRATELGSTEAKNILARMATK
jgi:hypothetical protein